MVELAVWWGQQHTVVTGERLELQHVQTVFFFFFKVRLYIIYTWLINICPTAVQEDALSFFADFFFSFPMVEGLQTSCMRH